MNKRHLGPASRTILLTFTLRRVCAGTERLIDGSALHRATATAPITIITTTSPTTTTVFVSAVDPGLKNEIRIGLMVIQSRYCSSEFPII